MEAFIKVFNNLKTDDELFEIHKIFVDKALGFDKGQSGILLNGRIIGKSNFQFFNFTTRESAITYVDDLTLYQSPLSPHIYMAMQKDFPSMLIYLFGISRYSLQIVITGGAAI